MTTEAGFEAAESSGIGAARVVARLLAEPGAIKST